MNIIDDSSLGFRRLLEEQMQAIKLSEEKIVQLSIFIQDYHKVLGKLSEQVKYISCNNLIPFGQKCFVRGKIIHTNEIVLHLGDDYYAEVSVFQAHKLIKRRIDRLKQNIKALEDQKKLLSDRETYVRTHLYGSTPIFSSNTKNVMANLEEKETEIREKFDPIKEQEWKRAHRENIIREREEKISCSLIDIDSLRSPDETSNSSDSDSNYGTIYYKPTFNLASAFKYPISPHTMNPSQAVNYFMKHKRLDNILSDYPRAELNKNSSENENHASCLKTVKPNPFSGIIFERSIGLKDNLTLDIKSDHISKFKASRLKKQVD